MIPKEVDFNSEGFPVLGNFSVQTRNNEIRVGHIHSPQVASEYFHKSTRLMGELGDAIGEGRGLENIGNVLSLKKDWDGALDMFQNALAIMEKMENQYYWITYPH